MKGSSKMKRKKVISFVCILILSLVFSSNVTSAYVAKSFKWAGSIYPITVTYKWGDRLTQPGVIKNGYIYALSDWNSMQMRINFSESSSSSNVLNSYTVTSSSEYGYCNSSYNTSTNTYNYFLAFVNTGNTHISESNVARSVAGHELGHGISLGEGNVADTLMDQGRDRTVTYRPTRDELDGINTIYN